MNKELINSITSGLPHKERLRKVSHSLLQGERLSVQNANFLFHYAPLPLIGGLAHARRTALNGSKAYYIKNIHVEYTNKCVNRCAFCSFRSRTDKDAWEMDAEEIIVKIRRAVAEGIDEVHLVGGIHPDNDIHFWLPILKRIRQEFPPLHIKAFTAAEIDFMIRKAGLSLKKGLLLLKQSGLDSIPGGGAEIFAQSIRKKLFHTKIGGTTWLSIHKQAHLLGIPSNATMLYGHIETVKQRIMHLDKLRSLQDSTGGFNAFIPLKFRNKNNELKGLEETTLSEDLRMIALCRLFLDNFPHIKAYWPMLGKEAAFLALDFGADDMDGTINNSTAIYSRAGAEEQSPDMAEDVLIHIIKMHRKTPVRRDGLYRKKISD